MKDTDRAIFHGFPAGGMRTTPLPNVVFSELLPRIDNLAEVKVTLHVYWLLHRKTGPLRCVSLAELLRDGTLLAGLAVDQELSRELLSQALESAVRRGSLLRLDLEQAGVAHQLYFANSSAGRDAIAKLRSAEIDLGQVVLDDDRAIVPDRPGVFELYEQNFGPLTPLLAEDLAEAESIYPLDWIEDAMREALRYNRRYWSYVRGILERWAFEGRKDEEGRGGHYRPRQAAP